MKKKKNLQKSKNDSSNNNNNVEYQNMNPKMIQALSSIKEQN